MNQHLNINCHEQVSVPLLQHLSEELQALWLVEHPVNSDAPNDTAVRNTRWIVWIFTNLLLEEVFIDVRARTRRHSQDLIVVNTLHLQSLLVNHLYSFKWKLMQEFLKVLKVNHLIKDVFHLVCLRIYYGAHVLYYQVYYAVIVCSQSEMERQLLRLVHVVQLLD